MYGDVKEMGYCITTKLPDVAKALYPLRFV